MIGGIAMFKLRSLQHWTEGHLHTLAHEKRVARVALELFDLLIVTHGLGVEHRRLLRMGAVVHDVGRCRGENNHAARGATMILQDRSLPLTPPERRLVAYLTQYHRGAVPALGEDGILVRGDGRAAALRMLALLRVADALDCRSLPSPAVRLRLRADRLCVECEVPDGVSVGKARRAFDKPKKFRLAEQLLNCRVLVKLRRAPTGRPQAQRPQGQLVGV